MSENKEKDTASSSWFVKNMDTEGIKDDAEIKFKERIKELRMQLN